MSYSRERDLQNAPAEELVQGLLTSHGYYVRPSQFLTKAAPALIIRPNGTQGHPVIANDNDKRLCIVEPDFLFFKDSQCGYIEVKARKTFNGQITITDQSFNDLVETERNSGIPTYYAVYLTDVAPVSTRLPAALVVCPVRILAE